jgi:hypothetical protein
LDSQRRSNVKRHQLTGRPLHISRKDRPLRYAKPAIGFALAVAAPFLAIGSASASASGPSYPIKRVVIDGACGLGTSTRLHGPLQSAPTTLKVCGGASAQLLDLVQLRWQHWGSATASATGIANPIHNTDSPPPASVRIRGPVTITVGGRSDNPRLFGPDESGGPVLMPPRTTYFYTWISVSYDAPPGRQARTQRLTFQADYPSDTPGDDSASGWQ